MVRRCFSLARRVIRSGYMALGSIRDPEIAADAAIAYSKLALAESIVNADIAPGAAIAGSKIFPDVTKAIVTTGPPAAMVGAISAITGYGTLTSGFSEVYYAAATLYEWPSLNANLVILYAGENPGEVEVEVYRPTSASNCTPVGATVAVDISWLIVGAL